MLVASNGLGDLLCASAISDALGSIQGAGASQIPDGRTGLYGAGGDSRECEPPVQEGEPYQRQRYRKQCFGKLRKRLPKGVRYKVCILSHPRDEVTRARSLDLIKGQAQCAGEDLFAQTGEQRFPEACYQNSRPR